MYSLVYVSAATSRFTHDDLVELLNQCHVSNARNNITGMLLYNGKGTFIQALEGHQKDIETLFEHIKKDPRHRRVMKLSATEIKERDFPNWKMGFRNVDSIPEQHNEVFSPFMQLSEDESAEYFGNHESAAIKMLSHFKSSVEELVF